MRAKRFFGAVAAASLLLGAAACGDDDDDAVDTTTTTQAGDEMATIEVTVTSDGFEGLPSEVPAGLVEVTLINESGAYASFDISRVEEGTTEQEFAEGLAPVLAGGEFPDFAESNAGIEADDGETTTSIIVLREGHHIAWFVPEENTPLADDDAMPTDDGTDEQGMAQGTLTALAVDDDTTTTVAGDDDTTTTVAGDDDTTTTTEDDDDGIATTQDDDEDGDGPGGDPGEGPQRQGPSADDFVTATLTVTEGDDDAELPEADGEIVAVDWDFEVDIDGPGTINFRNDGPREFHHAIIFDFGTNDPDDVEEALPTLLEAEGDPADADVDIDMDQVDFEFAGSGVFGPDGASGTFEADFQEGNTYVVICFIQDRTGGPPHAFGHDMWKVFQVGNGAGNGTTTTTNG